MLIATLKDQLGNQMFAYASIKAIAMDKGYDFGYVHMELEQKHINDSDGKYGNSLSSIFTNVKNEKVENIPSHYGVYKENFRKYLTCDYANEIREELFDNMVADGHFVDTTFFKHRLSAVRDWFSIPEDVDNKMEQYIQEIRKKNPNKKIIAVHFRVGKDYAKGFRLAKRYWMEAANYVMKMVENPLFICVYDVRGSAVKKFVKKYSAMSYHGSLVEDMCLMSKCDGNIVCNSSFSIMAAILNKSSQITIRPGKYPTEAGETTQNAFLPEWEAIGKGKRDFIAWIYYLRIRFLGW